MSVGRVCIRVLVFDKGELKETGSPAELRKDPDSMFAEMARHAPGLKTAAGANSEEDVGSSGFGTSTDEACSQINGGLP